MSNWGRKIGLGAVAAMVALAGYGIVAQYKAATQLNPIIEKTLIEPYAAAIRAGEYERAYKDYTSAEFRKTVSLAEFEKAHKDNLGQYGKLVSLALRPNGYFQAEGNLFSGESYYRGGLLYRGEKAEALVNWEVCRENDAFKIRASFEERLERLDPRVY